MKLLAVAGNTFRESIRNRLLLNMIGFAAVLLGLSFIVSSWSLGEPLKILTDLGLSMTVLVGLITAVLAGALLVWAEVEQHTLLAVLAKPLSRSEFIVGKTLGAAGAVLLLYLAMALLLVGTLALLGRPLTLQVVAAVYLGAWEILVVTALAMLFSAFTSPTVSALATVMMFLAGRFSRDISIFIEHNPDAGARPLLEAVYYLIPHLSSFNLRNAAVHSLPLEWEQVLWPTLYGLAYSAALLFIAVWAFNRRDLA